MRDYLTFRLNGEVQTLRDIPPALTLLTFLRDRRRLTGTKEGCAEGDCGACTVVIGELIGDVVTYRAVNACILFIGMLEGKSVFTVEALKAPDGGLHPVQQAMVDEHGSQCGFCTPGFVMSLYAAYVSGAPLDRESAADLLAGNLCRCTGYGPIAAAADKIRDYPAPPGERARLDADRQWIRDQANNQSVDFTHEGQRFVSPGNIDDLAATYASAPEATLVGGATDVGLWVTKMHQKLPTVIHLGRVRALQTITRTEDKLIIGAGVTYADALAVIGELFPDFAEMTRRIGAVQVRNAGTIGGNVANGSPIGDTPPALIVLNATLILRQGDARRRLPIEEFFIDYGKQDRASGEFLESIEIPLPGPGGDFKCYKISKRFDQDISAVCGCFAVSVADGKAAAARIAFGGMAATPKRARAVEAALIGREWNEETVAAAVAAFDEDFQPITDMRASAGYRRDAAGNLLRRYYRERMDDLSTTRLVGRGADVAGARTDSSIATDPPDSQAVKGDVRAPQRHDSGHKHVAGEAVFVDDIRTPEGTLAVHVAMSDKAHAKILNLDLSPVRGAPGVVCVISAEDIPGKNDISPAMGDDPLFAVDLVEYAGQSLFVVAAETLEQARDAAGLALIDYEELPAVVSIDEAMAQELYLEAPYVMARGDAEDAIAAAPHSLSGRVYMGGQEHFYLEGQAALAVPGEDGDVTVHSSTQHPSEIQHTIAKVLGLANHDVTVECRRMGGAFGGKESNGNLPAAAAALIAAKTGRAAKVRYDRDQDMIITGKRHDFRIDYRVGFDGEGRIEGIEFDQAGRCGMSYDLSVPICDRAMFHADNTYYLPNVKITSYRCKTHTVSNTAFRGFGGPQGMVGIERVVDEIAHHLGRDPLEVRRANFYDPMGTAEGAVKARAVTPYDMTVEDCIIEDLVAELRDSADYDQRRTEIRTWNAANTTLKRGLALTPVKFGISFTLTFLNQAGALVHVYNDGSIHLNHGGTEMGQGLFTKVAQVAARAFQVDIDRIKITATHTGKVPNTSATAASSGSDLNGMATADACAKIKKRLTDFAAERWQTTPDQVEFLPGRIRIGSAEVTFEELVSQAYQARVSLSATGFYATPKINWDKEQAKGRPFFYFAYGAAVTEVAIDTLTGENRMLRVDILHDVGKSLNPAIDLGQIEGGFIQGAGWLTTEELWWDERGHLKTHAPSTYKIPTLGDRAPDMRINLWSRGGNVEETIHRSKAVGEPPLMLGISTLMALSDAVAAAGDYQQYPQLDAPATPERILEAVRRVTKTGEQAA